MTRKTKILLGFLGFFLTSIAMCVIWFYQPQNYFSFHQGVRLIELQGKIKILRQNNYCAKVDNKTDCFQAFIVANENIQFSADLPMYQIAMSSVCEENNKDCFNASFGKIVEALEYDKLWFKENLNPSTPDYKTIHKDELGRINNLLRSNRIKLVDQYNSEINPAKKIILVNFVKQIDAKIITLQKLTLN